MDKYMCYKLNGTTAFNELFRVLCIMQSVNMLKHVTANVHQWDMLQWLFAQLCISLKLNQVLKYDEIQNTKIRMVVQHIVNLELQLFTTKNAALIIKEMKLKLRLEVF